MTPQEKNYNHPLTKKDAQQNNLQQQVKDKFQEKLYVEV